MFIAEITWKDSKTDRQTGRVDSEFDEAYTHRLYGVSEFALKRLQTFWQNELFANHYNKNIEKRETLPTIGIYLITKWIAYFSEHTQHTFEEWNINNSIFEIL